MSILDDVRRALQSLIDQGIVHEVHVVPHATNGPGTLMPGQVNVSAQINAPNPEGHREEILRHLERAGLRKVNLILHPNYSRA